MRNLLRLVRTAPLIANTLVSAAIVALVIKGVWLDSLPELFRGAHRIGIVVEAILVSIIASYIFYLFVVHLVRLQDKDAINPYISNQLSIIVGCCDNQIKELSKVSGHALSIDAFTEESIRNCFSNIDPNGASPAGIFTDHFINISWLQYLSRNKNKTKDAIKRVLQQIQYLDASLVRAVVEVDNCVHFMVVDMIDGVNVGGKNMVPFAKFFYSYATLCKELRSEAIKIGVFPHLP